MRKTYKLIKDNYKIILGGIVLALRINAHIGVLGTFNERYVPGGYFDEIEFDKMLEIMGKIEGLDGLSVWYPGHPLIDEPEKLKKKLENNNLEIADIGPEIWSDRKWKYGTISATDKKIRKEAIKIIKHNIDLAVELNAYSVLLWPAHDGFDYSFQVNYDKSWGYMIESLNEVGEHNRDVK
ncbi:MAG: TIM barrel protein, partial [Bacteroidales bacterium]